MNKKIDSKIDASHLDNYRVFELKYVAKQYKIKVSDKKDGLIKNIIEKCNSEVTIKNPHQIIKEHQKEILEIKNKTKPLIDDKNFYEVISNSNVGFFNGLPKDCLLYICSFLGEIDIYLFSLTNKTIRTIFKTPTLQPTVLKYIQNPKIMIFVPQVWGEFLNLSLGLKVNKYYIVPKKLLHLVLFYKLYPHFTISKQQSTYPLVFLKESIKDINVPMTSKQLYEIDNYLKNPKREIWSSYFVNLFTYEFKSIEWDLTLWQTSFIHTEINNYKQRMSAFTTTSIQNV
jgi:hypothetical protein